MRHLEHKIIRLVKKEIFYDIDALTYKRAESGTISGSIQNMNGISSDSSENLDGSILSRFADARDTEIRSLLLFCLKDRQESYADNVNDRESPVYEYWLTLPPDFEDSRLQIAATKMHQYIVYGSVLDWDLSMGIMPPANMTESSIDSLGAEIAGLLRGRSWRTRPMQPFGPAYRIKK